MLSYGESCGEFKTNGPKECVQIVADALIEAIQCAAFVVGKESITTKGCQQICSERSISGETGDLLDQLTAMAEEVSKLPNAYATAILASGS